MDERFEKIYTQGKLNIMEIWVDKETGVQYVYHFCWLCGWDVAAFGRRWETVTCRFI
ncbi:conserved hypothetical protein [Listeria monocytogenes]|nr:hypothetical protein AOA13_112 [Listeria monocytogenes]CUK55269.1 conserved hypothetical protein [Listeria monocytogenes]CUK85730.1 conserved hypothetical protein [Listeria monocytogenes]CUL50919.1 conserved hypothetical protein [Listeria monocytogenes]CUL78106.1 conserved hypothetical protein [Listeria monocytogenes]